MTTLRLFCLLAVLPLIASNDKSKVLECVCDGGPDCKNNICSVDKDGACAAIAANTTMELSASGMYRTCFKKADACKGGIVSITVEKGVYWRSNTLCCTTDKCNNVTLKVQPAETTFGQVTCPSCIGANASSCKPTNMLCAESETHCLNITGAIKSDHSALSMDAAVDPAHSGSDSGKNAPEKSTKTTPERNITFFARGCATEEGIVGSNIPLILHEDTFYFTVSHGNPSLVSGSTAFTILLPGLIGLLLDKFLY